MPLRVVPEPCWSCCTCERTNPEPVVSECCCNTLTEPERSFGPARRSWRNSRRCWRRPRARGRTAPAARRRLLHGRRRTCHHSNRRLRTHSGGSEPNCRAAARPLAGRCLRGEQSRNLAGDGCGTWAGRGVRQRIRSLRCLTDVPNCCMHPRRPEDAARIAAMAARVEAMERALAAREAQVAGGRAASHHSASANGQTAIEGRRIGRGQQRPAASRGAQAVAGVPEAMRGHACAEDTLRRASATALRSSAQQCAWVDPQSAPSSPGAVAHKQRPAPRGYSSERRSSEVPLLGAARASDAGSPRSMAGRWQAEAQCGRRDCSLEAVANAPTQLVYQQPSAARASREATAASQPDARASVYRPRSSLSSGDRGYRGAPSDHRERWPIAAAPPATLWPAARIDEEPKPRALLPAPLRPRAASASSCRRSQSDATAQMQTADRVQPEPSHTVHSDSGASRGRLQPRTQPRGSSDHGAWRPPAAIAAGRASRQGSVVGVGDAAAYAGQIEHASSPRDGECAHPGHPASRVADDPGAAAAENAALREALRSNDQALAAAQDATQLSAARYAAAIEQLADTQRAARADAERADAQMQQLTEELARCASVLQRLA